MLIVSARQDKPKDCSPITIASIYEPINIPWEYWKEFRGSGLIEWLCWYCGEQATPEEYEEYLHRDMIRKKECHIYKDLIWCYCLD